MIVLILMTNSPKNIPADKLRMHLCWGNYEGPHHRDIALSDIIDIVLKADPATTRVVPWEIGRASCRERVCLGV